MQKTTRILISSLAFVAILISAIASGWPVTVVQADQQEEISGEDVSSNVVFDGNVAFNDLRDPSEVPSRATLDGERNNAAVVSLSGNPFADEPAYFQPAIDISYPAFSTGMGYFLSDEWQLHLMGSGLGDRGINIGDIDSDGTVEIVVADNQAGYSEPDNRWFVLRPDGMGGYDQIYYSETYPVAIHQVLTADVDSDGTSEIYVALSTNNLLVYSGRDYSLSASFSPEIVPSSMVVADADGDGKVEIILSDNSAIAAYEPTSFQRLWQGPGVTGGGLAVANVDADASLEIISSRGYVLDGATRAVEWSYPSGFSSLMDVGDVDGDGMAEIVGDTSDNRITIFDADLKSPAWEISTPDANGAILVADVTGDDRSEILCGGNEWGYIHAFDGFTRLELWRIAKTNNGITRIAVGDTDQDAELEVLWGAGYSSGGADNLYVAGTTSHAVEWQSSDLDGPMYAVDCGDVDDDGRVEIIAVSYTSESHYEDGVIHIFNAETHELEWRSTDLPGIDASRGVRSIRIGDVDQDGQTEFVIATSNYNDGVIQIYNGKTHELKYRSAVLTGVNLTAMELGDVDGDERMEIVVGQEYGITSTTKIQLVVFGGASAIVEWLSGTLGTGYGDIYDVLLADIDLDGQVEISASVRDSNVFVFNGQTHELEMNIATKANALESADLDGDGIPSILVGKDNGDVESYNGFSHSLEATYHFSSKPVACLKMADLDLDQVPEWLVCSGDALMVYSQEGGLLWQSRDLSISSSLGEYNQIPVGQIDDDEYIEILVGSVDAVYQYEQGNALWPSRMIVSREQASPGDILTYSIEISNATVDEFATAVVSNPLPAQLSFVDGSLSATGGSTTYEDGVVHWTGGVNTLQTITVSYQAIVKDDFQVPATIRNTAELTAGEHTVSVSTETLAIYRSFLPLCTKPFPNDCADFHDDFENPASGWPVDNDEFARFEYLDGEYRMLAIDPDYFYMVKAPTCKRQNYTVSVDARWEGIPGNMYGLIFGLADDFSQYYLFLVDATDLNYMLYYYDDVNGYQLLSLVANSSFIKKGASNHLQVVRNGSRIELSINGYDLGSDYNARITGLTKVGLVNMPYYYSRNADARFDNFNVTYMTASGALTQPLTGPFEPAETGISLPWFKEKLDPAWTTQDPPDER